MTKTLLLAAAGALSLISASASAQNFDGHSIRYQFRFPDTTTAVTTLNAVVGAGVEFNDAANFYTVDLSGSSFVVTDLYGGGNSQTAFNGIVLSDITNNLASITGVTFASGGFAGERPVLSFDANNIFLNFANITQTTLPGTQYRYNVTFAAATGAVPEPATWAMMLMGFGAVGFAMRRRQSVATRIRFA